MKEKVVILGGGESGVGAALLAQKEGFEVWLSDNGKINDRFKRELDENQIKYEEGGHTHSQIFDANWVVKSPGIPDTVPMIMELKEQGMTVFSEIEFASKYFDGTIIGITGSNGKTTTTMLLGHLLQEAGLNVVIGGNVGISFARIVATQQVDTVVLELSSFQLDGILDFRPDIALLLNISPDHLDRYGYQMERYVASKFRIAMNQKKDDLFLINSEDSIIQKFDKSGIKAQIEVLGAQNIQARVLTHGGEVFTMKTTQLKGQHNEMNALFAIAAAQRMQLTQIDIQMGLDSFSPVEHRTEPVAEVDGVLFVNDSKATNVDAVYYALLAEERPIVWIVGGQDKGNDYSILMPLVRAKVKAIVCMGIDNQKILDFFANEQKEMIETRSAKEAVRAAKKLAEAGDVVLLSPACASFDLFKNYEDRGRLFKKAVLELKQ